MDARQLDDTDDQTGDETPSFNAGEVEVKDHGRVTIPHRLRDRYDVEEGTVVDIRVHTPGVSFVSPNRIVDSKGRVTIPNNERQIYDVESGDMVGVSVAVTDLTADNDD